MATKSPWSTIGAWAAESERADEEEKQAAAAAQRATAPVSTYPSLKESSVTSSGKQKKKTKMTLHEFTMSSSSPEMARLPTRPYGDEMQHGFSNNGSRVGSGGAGRIREYGDSEGGLNSFDSPGRQSRYADLGGGGTGGFSKADEVDNWASMKKSQPPPPSGQLTPRASFGSGFRNEVRPPGAEPERWARNISNSEDQEPRLGMEQPPVIAKVNKPNPFGAARPREEVLMEKGVDLKKLDEDIDVKKVAGISRPTSSKSSRPGSSQSVKSDGSALQQQQPQDIAVEVPAVKPKSKVNPFGNAKPREVLLAEKGLDWRKIDLELEHKRIDRPETDEEKNLKEEIENLKKDSLQKSDEEQSNLHDEIIKKEKDLELLIRQLDDKVRFGQKNNDSPGSGPGRYSGPPARISSQPRPSQEPRGAVEFMDRPRSRGTVESWPRQNDDRRSFSGGRDRGGFVGSREIDRSNSRNRW